MTIIDKFLGVVKDHGHKTALAFLVDDEYKQVSYRKLDKHRQRLAHYWQDLGLKKGDRVSVMLNNSPEWITSDLAVATLGAIIVPIHTTYNSDYIVKIIEHAEPKFLIVAREFFDKHKFFIKKLSLEKIIIVGVSQDIVGDNIVGWPILDMNGLPETELVELSADDAHTIIYTSGTTGDPKGVVLSHKNLISNTESALRSVPIFASDRFFSFLPLSHAFERTAGYYSPILAGASIYFARNAKTIIEDIKKAKPTVLSSVPRIFDKIYGKVFDKAEAGQHWQKVLFFKGLQLAVLKRKHALSFWQKIYWLALDVLVLKKLRAVFGGHLRLAISGGASLDVKIIRFFDNLGINMIEGYGMTEASPIITVNTPGNVRFGTVGHSLDCNTIKILGTKEILVKGDNVMSGYYKNEVLTKDIIDSDGWLHTGDLGFMDKEGFLTIIGRAKDVIVLSTGKNIFPEPIENVLNESRYITQSMVYGNGQKYLSALIVPNFEQLKLWCKEQGVSYNLQEEKVKEFYKHKIAEKLKRLADVEQIKDFKLLSEEFSQENGFLTPTLKLKRHRIIAKYVV